MMNDNWHDYLLEKHFDYRRDQLMDEARRERLKASVLRRARRQETPRRGLFHAIADLVAGLYASLRRLRGAAIVEQPGVTDDCFESSPT